MLISVILCGAVIGIGIGRGRDATDMVKVGISLAVSVIPEGITIILQKQYNRFTYILFLL